MGQLFAGIDLDDVRAFDAAVRLSKAPAVAALLAMPISADDPLSLGRRIDAAKAVAAKGYAVDFDIDVLHAWPYFTFRQRWIDGFSYVPSAAQNFPSGAGPAPPGAIACPDMSLPISKLVAFFPPDPSNIAPPASPASPTSVSPVGQPIGFQWEVEINGQPVMLEGYWPTDPHESFPEGFQYGGFLFHYLGTSLMAVNTRSRVWLKLP